MPEYEKYLPIKLNETWKPEVQQLIESKKMFYSSESLLEVQNKHPFYRSGRAKPGFHPEKLTKEKEIEKLVKRLNQIEAEAKEIRVKLKSIEYESKTHETKSAENKAKNSNIRKKNSASEKNKDSDILNPESKNDLTEKSNKECEMKKLVKINDIEKIPDLQEEAVEPKSKSSVNHSKQSTTGENIKNDTEIKETHGSIKIKSELGKNNDDSKNMHISNKVV